MHRKTLTYILLIITSLITASCDLRVKEYPWPEPTSDLELLLVRNRKWTFDDFYINHQSRAVSSDSLALRYVIRAFPRGSKTGCVSEQFIYVDDLDCDSLRATIALPPGEWDLRVWNDLVDRSTHQPLTYNTDNFGRISLQLPYFGSNTCKDAFCGTGSIEMTQSSTPQHCSIELTRPITAIVLIADDIRDFLAAELTRTRADVSLESYTVKVIYPGYLPHVYSHFSGNTIDALTGMQFESKITRISADEAMMAFDHILVSPDATGVQLALTVSDRAGNTVASLAPTIIPVTRGHCTLARGRFLTVKSGCLPFINSDFNGDINILIP